MTLGRSRRGGLGIAQAAATAFALCGLAVSPAWAEDAAPAAPAVAATPAAVNGQFDDYCAMGLAEGQEVKTDCSINWTAEDGKVYCFSSKASKETFLKNPTENIQKAREFFIAKDNAAPAAPAAENVSPSAGPAKEFTEDDVNAAVKQVVDARSKDGTFVFHDPKLNADLNLVFESIKIVRGMEGYGWFANSSSTTRTSPRSNMPSTSGSSPKGKS